MCFVNSSCVYFSSGIKDFQGVCRTFPAELIDSEMPNVTGLLIVSSVKLLR